MKRETELSSSSVALQSNLGEFYVIYLEDNKFKCQLETVFVAGLFFIATLAGLPFIIVTDFAILSLTAATKSD
jgi:hypothetical protein